MLNVLGLIATCIALVVSVTASASAQSYECDAKPVYVNRNMVDYGPIVVTRINGRVLMEQTDGTILDAIPACIALFTEKGHRLVARSEAGDNGYFKLKRVSYGNYRLVVRDPQGVFCPANVKVRIAKRRRSSRRLAVHMRAAGIDTCSFVDTNTKRIPK